MGTLVSESGVDRRVCERRMLRVNIGKSKFMRSSKNVDVGRTDVGLNGEPLEEVHCFKYLGSQLASDGGCEGDVVHRLK